MVIDVAQMFRSANERLENGAIYRVLILARIIMLAIISLPWFLREEVRPRGHLL